METKQTPAKIFDDEVKRKIIYKEMADALTVQLDIVYNMLMNKKKPTAEELVDEINISKNKQQK